jgi:hypothetical protein
MQIIEKNKTADNKCNIVQRRQKPPPSLLRTLAATNKNKKYKLAIVDYEKNSIRKSIGQLIKRYFQALLIKYEKRIGSLKLIGNIKR